MLANAKRIVIKIGSSLLTDEAAGRVRETWLAAMAADIHQLKSQGKEIIVVTSGAIALGRLQLGLKSKSQLGLEEKQAAAACGQIELSAAWRDALSRYQVRVAQLLLTADDSIERNRYLNARNTVDALLELGAVPIINENDTVATAEIRFGDNDRLSARIAQMAGADLLILLSDIDGLYSANPSERPDAQFIAEVPEITPDIEKMAGGSSSDIGSGGMITKIAAAKIAVKAGCHMVIARGTGLNPLRDLMGGRRCTRFIAKQNPIGARKHWIAGSLHPAGSVVIDDGAASALKSGKSLLPAGVRAIEGTFARGDAVIIKDQQGRVLGKGLIAYSAEDAQRIKGQKSREIEKILGFKRKDVLIHRDDLVLEN